MFSEYWTYVKVLNLFYLYVINLPYVVKTPVDHVNNRQD